MNYMKLLVSSLFVLVCQLANCQEFKTTIWIEDGNGRVDSIHIGYDPLASEGIDEIFGALDISDQNWSEFEIRASQIDVTEIINGGDLANPRPIDELSRYQTKTEIIPKNCLSMIEVSNQAGYIPFITLFIASDYYPFTIKWNPLEFESNCVSKSIISDWPISTWWDIPCCANLEIHQTRFENTNEITINNHLGVQVVNENFDTLIMLNVALQDGLGTNTKDMKNEPTSKIYPNPANGVFYLPPNVEIISILDKNGNRIAYQTEGQQIWIESEGLYFVQMQVQGRIITKKIINCSR